MLWRTFGGHLSLLACAVRFKTLSLLDAILPRETLQSECALSILQRMEQQQMIPEAETHNLLIKVDQAYNNVFFTAEFKRYGVCRNLGPPASQF
jgi:hypothetical protein